MSSFRVNASLSTAEFLGGTAPGGTNVVLFIDSVDHKLKAIFPDGTVKVSSLVPGTTNITFGDI